MVVESPFAEDSHAETSAVIGAVGLGLVETKVVLARETGEVEPLEVSPTSAVLETGSEKDLVEAPEYDLVLMCGIVSVVGEATMLEEEGDGATEFDALGSERVAELEDAVEEAKGSVSDAEELEIVEETVTKTEPMEVLTGFNVNEDDTDAIAEEVRATVCERECDCDKEAPPVLAEVSTGFTELEEDTDETAEVPEEAEELETALDEAIDEWDECESDCDKVALPVLVEEDSGFTNLEEDTEETAEVVAVAEELETALDDALDEADELETTLDEAIVDWDVNERECDSESECDEVTLPVLVGTGFSKLEENTDETAEVPEEAEELDSARDEAVEEWDECESDCDKVALPVLVEEDSGFTNLEEDTEETAEVLAVAEELETALDDALDEAGELDTTLDEAIAEWDVNERECDSERECDIVALPVLDEVGTGFTELE
ncbi:hypothetical protein HDU98_009746 [Podochytrium sp. JEL0797]|nr:hypothetical protein HDU98_009746 [Podochytrium sp. JEL0797]